MVASVTKARAKQLRDLLALKIQKKQLLEEAETWMRDFQSQQSETTQTSILSSSSAARQRRTKHKDRETFEMERTVQVNSAMLDDLNKEIAKIDAEIKELEELFD
ncbi:MAG: hypothetical protein M1813_000891 [Trichoglossum hirsutum]|jgi:hypothetical protein|nr:MAG: hypothetical protein M1813_000891 [Trichoglossum hirsutum]